MNFVLLLPYYARWHYSQAFKDLAYNWKTFLILSVRFFSIPLLLKTLFSPWQRMQEDYKQGLDVESFFSTLLVNTIMRIVGFVMRLIVILIGVVATVVVFLVGIFSFVLWALFPFVLAFLLALSINSIL